MSKTFVALFAALIVLSAVANAEPLKIGEPMVCSDAEKIGDATVEGSRFVTCRMARLGLTAGNPVHVAPAAGAMPTNITQLAGNPINLGAGNVGAGTLRVTIATNDVNSAAQTTSLAIMDDWDEADRAKVNPIVGQAGVAAGAGIIGANTQRVTVATDDTLVTNSTAILADTAIMSLWEDGANNANVNIAAQSLTAVKVSDDANANAINNPMYMQISQDGTNAVAAANPLPVSSTMAANALNNTIKVELSDGTNAFFDSTSYPGYVRNQDGDGTDLQDVLSTFADNLAYTLNGAVNMSVMYVDDGATLDMVKAGASGGVTTEVQNWPSAFSEGDANVTTHKGSVAAYTPAATTGTAVDSAGGGTTGDIVLASTEVIGYPNWTLYIKNAGGGSGDALASVYVMVSPDGTNWYTITNLDADETAAQTLASGATGIAYMARTMAHRYVKLEALCAGGDDTTVDAWIVANVN